MQLTFKTAELRAICERLYETEINIDSQTIESIKTLLLDIEAIEGFEPLKQYFHFWNVSINFDASIIIIKFSQNCIIELELLRLKKASNEITGIKIISIKNG